MNPGETGYKLSGGAMLWRLAPYLRPYLWLVVIGIAMIPLIAAAGVWRPLLLKQAVDEKIATHDLTGVKVLAIYFLGAVIVEFLASAVQNYTWQRAGHALIHDLRRALFVHVMRLPARVFDKTPVGTLVARTTNDVEALSETMAFGVFTIITDIFLIGATLVTMFELSAKVTLASLSLAPFLFLLIRYFSTVLRRLHNEIRQAQGSQIGFLTEQLTGVTVLQLFGRQQPAVDRFAKIGHSYLQATKRANIFDALLFSVMDGLSAFCVALLIYVGAHGVLGTSSATGLTLGLLFAFVDYLQRIFVPIKEFSGKLATVQRAVASLDRIFGLFDQPIETSPASPSIDGSSGEFTGAIRVRDLCFAYDVEAPDVLRGLSFEVKRGQVVAIVGRSGSGKTSLGRVLTRAYEGYRGAVELQWRHRTGETMWVSARDLPHDLLRSGMLLVQQDVFLFDDTVRFNVSLGRRDLLHDDARLWAALETTQAADFVRERGGLDASIGARGSNLSAGQGQLLAFARVAAWSPPALILDEATSCVDSVTERKVQTAIEHLLVDRTVLVIAHRLSTVRHADMILVMDHGQIIERGTHDELMGLNRRYAELYRSGFEETPVEAAPQP